MKNRVRELRKAYDLTQESLAKRVGVSRQSIVSIETGRYNPSLELAYKIARQFNLKIEDVFIFEDKLNHDERSSR